MGSDLEIPAQVSLSYHNIINDYSISTEHSDRLISGQASTATVQMPLCMLPAEAKGVADALLFDQLASLTSTTIRLPLRYAFVEPGDVIEVVNFDGRSYRLRVVAKRDTLSILEMECVLDDVGALQSATVTDGGYISVAEPVRVAPTVFQALDIPILRDADNDAGYYAAVAADRESAADQWDGAVFVQAFSADAFARVLRQRANKNGDHDEIRLTYDPAVKSRHGGGVISIEIINSFRDLEQEYQIDLLAVASEPSAAAFDNVDFVSVINDASLFTSFLQSVIQAEGGVMNGSLSIYVNEEEVVLEVPAGVFLRSSRLVLLTSKGMKNKELVGRRATRRIKEGTIKKTFVLQHFCLLAKFFEACSNSTMTLYLKNQPEHFPVVFEGMFGAIGTVKIACVPFVDESLL
jgi:hypothetical protein